MPTEYALITEHLHSAQLSESLANAMEAVKEGMSQNMAAKRFGIPLAPSIAITEVISKHLHGLIEHDIN